MTVKGNGLGRMRLMWYLSLVFVVLTVLLRVWILPANRDWDTGLFTSSVLTVGFMLLCIAVQLVLSCTLPKQRQEISGRSGLPLAFTLLLAGTVLGVVGVLGLIESLTTRTASVTASKVLAVLQLLEAVFAVLGGASLVRMGLVLISEGGTRQGMAQWSALAPVLWMWFRLAAYEASFAGTVRMSDSFFHFVMFILELVFLFKLARYTAGVGQANIRSLMFWSTSTVLFALSTPLVRVCMYLLQDSEAYLAGQQVGVADAAVGVLALAVCFSLWHSAAQSEQESSSDEESIAE